MQPVNRFLGHDLSIYVSVSTIKFIVNGLETVEKFRLNCPYTFSPHQIWLIILDTSDLDL